LFECERIGAEIERDKNSEINNRLLGGFFFLCFHHHLLLLEGGKHYSKQAPQTQRQLAAAFILEGRVFPTNVTHEQNEEMTADD